MKNVVYGNEITEKIIENVCYYAKHKYSSNVVEKCFEYCDGLTRQKLICSLIKSEIIGELMFDEHGNYIIQKALACSDVETQKIILRALLPQFNKLKELHFGERIISRLSKTYAGIIEGIKGEKGAKKNNGDGNSGHKGNNKGSGKKNKSKNNNNNNNRTNQGSPPGKGKKDY
jgi:pumilio RNA-binding family